MASSKFSNAIPPGMVTRVAQYTRRAFTRTGGGFLPSSRRPQVHHKVSRARTGSRFVPDSATMAACPFRIELWPGRSHGASRIRLLHLLTGKADRFSTRAQARSPRTSNPPDQARLAPETRLRTSSRESERRSKAISKSCANSAIPFRNPPANPRSSTSQLRYDIGIPQSSIRNHQSSSPCATAKKEKR